MKAILSEMKNIEIIEPMVTIKSAMKENNIEEMKQLISKIL